MLYIIYAERHMDEIEFLLNYSKSNCALNFLDLPLGIEL